MKDSYGIIDFLELFTEEYCLEYFTQFRYSEGIFCPHCGYKKPYVTDRGYKCASNVCGKKFTIKSNTLFEDSKISIRDWFFIIYCTSHNKKNLSSVQIGKNMSLTQNTAWKLQSKIRSILTQDKIVLSGIVEVDEAFISKGEWYRYGGMNVRKSPVLGLIERGGKVLLIAIPNRKRESIVPIVQKHVEPGATIYTDAFQGYKKLDGFIHDYVNHSAKEFVRGKVHTNSIENVWSFFKKNIRNSHHSISEKHLQSYLDEAAFKFNNRALTQMERFNMILTRCIYG